MIKLNRSNPFQYFFFTDISKFILKIRHISFIIAIRYIRVDKFIHKMKKLSPSYFFSARNIQPVKLRIGHFFKLLYFKNLPAVADGYAYAAFSGAGSTTAPVRI